MVAAFDEVVISEMNLKNIEDNFWLSIINSFD